MKGAFMIILVLTAAALAGCTESDGNGDGGGGNTKYPPQPTILFTVSIQEDNYFVQIATSDQYTPGELVRYRLMSGGTPVLQNGTAVTGLLSDIWIIPFEMHPGANDTIVPAVWMDITENGSLDTSDYVILLSKGNNGPADDGMTFELVYVPTEAVVGSVELN